MQGKRGLWQRQSPQWARQGGVGTWWVPQHPGEWFAATFSPGNIQGQSVLYPTQTLVSEPFTNVRVLEPESV